MLPEKEREREREREGEGEFRTEENNDDNDEDFVEIAVGKHLLWLRVNVMKMDKKRRLRK